MTANKINFQRVTARSAGMLLLAAILVSVSGLSCSRTTDTNPVAVDRPTESKLERSDKKESVSTKEEPAAEMTNCVNGEEHPLATGIADEFEVEYEAVTKWFCEGFTFDDILLALQTSELTGEPVESLLSMTENMEWQEIWDELGVTTSDLND